MSKEKTTKKENKKTEKIEKTSKNVKNTNNKKNTSKEKNKKTNKPEVQKKHFLKDVKSEMKKVRWPLKKEMLTYSLATLSMIIIFALFFVACDLIISGIRMIFI